MKNELVIAGRPVGPAHPPLVVAELGINHEGSLQTAFEMVDAAARVGVEVLKHQTHIVEDEMCGVAKQVVPGNADVSIYEIMSRCALSEEDETVLTNLYPTPANLVRLGAMQEMVEAFPGYVYGLSDHTTSNLACLSAVALGASIVERHFTDRMDRRGPDICCSMDEQATRELIEQSRLIHSMRGGHKEPLPEEQVTIDFAYATVVTIRPVKKGECFTRENLWVKRPGVDGILAGSYESILGKRATVDIDEDVQLLYGMIEK